MSHFYEIVNDMVTESSDINMNKLLKWLNQNDATDEDIVYLARALAKSGTILNHSNKQLAADIASTGGPGSLTTILCPLFLVALGCTVPKLGVPGRPAGGIDVLAQIPGFKYQFNEGQAAEILSCSRYVHFMASDRFAPLDAKLFEYRKKNGAINNTILAIASILSKKIALGVHLIGLDVRVAPHGNFGSTFEIAHNNAQRFCRVSTLAGCTAVCFLTDNRVPPQPYIGRGESLLALSQIFNGQGSSWLNDHVDVCHAMAGTLVDKTGSTIHNPSLSDIVSIFKENLEAQGASWETFTSYVEQVQEAPRYELLADKDGFLSVDMERIRDIITSFQAKDNNQSSFPDSCGVVLNKVPGRRVRKGEKIASIRFSMTSTENPTTTFSPAITIESLPNSGVLFEEVFR